MTLGELIAVTRIHLRDTLQPYQVDDALLILFLNEAQQEAAIRGRLLRATPKNSPTLCNRFVPAGLSTITLDDSIYELSYQEWEQDGERWPMGLVSREWMDDNFPRWRLFEPGKPTYLIQDGQGLQISPPPAVQGNVLLEGYRLPIPMEDVNQDEPDIPKVHHLRLVQWALHRSLASPGSEIYDEQKAAIADAEFTRYFGLPADSDLGRATRSDVPQTNKVFWP